MFGRFVKHSKAPVDLNECGVRGLASTCVNIMSYVRGLVHLVLSPRITLYTSWTMDENLTLLDHLSFIFHS